MATLPRALLSGAECVCVCVCVCTCRLSARVSSRVSLGPGTRWCISLFLEPQLSARPGAECWECRGRPHACNLEPTDPWEKADVY